MLTYVRTDAQTIQTELTGQLTTFMRNDVRADAQTTTELTAQSTTFLRTDVRADAQTSIELTAQFTTFMTTDVTPCRPARVLYSPVNTSGIHTLLYTSQLKWRQPGQLCSDCACNRNTG